MTEILTRQLSSNQRWSLHIATSTAAALLAIVMTCLLASAQPSGRRQPHLELQGKYATNPEGCRAHHRRWDGLTTIEGNDLTWGTGTANHTVIASSRRTQAGIVLHLVSRGNPEGFRQTWKRLDDEVFEVQSHPTRWEPNPRVETHVRCGERDAIAGIGYDPRLEGAVTAAPQAMFAAAYVLALPSTCPSLRIDRSRAEQAARVAQIAYADFLRAGPSRNMPPGPDAMAAEAARAHQSTARNAVQTDAHHIRNFCDVVLDFFGRGGKVQPDMIEDHRRRA